MTYPVNYKILNSYHLKWIALITMIIDHTGLVFFPDLLFLRIIGRCAFILYAFMLVEGIYYTRNSKKYLFKLFIWAIISEVAFDLIFQNKIIEFSSQNIFFTLFTGALILSVFKENKSIFFNILVGLIGLVVAYLLKMDYSWYGVLIIYLFYIFKNNQTLKLVYIEFASIIASFNVFLLQFFAFIGFIPILLYNGKLGKKFGDIYYSFYAIHLIILYIIKILITKL